MVYLDWDDFIDQATKMYTASPNTTRYTQKFRGENKVVVLKVTDNRVCIKHKVKVARDVKKIDAFNAIYMRLATAKTV